MELKDIQNSFKLEAAGLGDYNLMTKTDLANGYCDAEEAAIVARAAGDTTLADQLEKKRSEYYAALMLRYWYKIFEWIRNSSSLQLDPCEFVSWLSDSLYVAFYYRMWRYEYEAIVKHGKFESWKYDENGDRIPNQYYWELDPNAPDKIINRCCASMRGRVYQYHNKDKRRTDIQASSLDSMIDESGDSAIESCGCYNGVDIHIESGTYALVSEFLKRDQGIEALIIDGIANYKTYKAHKERTKIKVRDEETNELLEKTIKVSVAEFDARSLVRHLAGISQKFMRQFSETYSISTEAADNIYGKLKGMSNPKLYKCIKKTLIEVKETPKLLSCLM